MRPEYRNARALLPSDAMSALMPSGFPEDQSAPPRADWSRGELPQTWPDSSGLRLFGALLRAPWVKDGTVTLPEGFPGMVLPRYALRPFHGLPNGYYSHSVARGYDTGFEVSMLGRVAPMRARMARVTQELLGPGGLGQVLDVGCGTGRLGAAFAELGARDVVGIDPSPYLLQVASERTPHARFVQGLAEKLPFLDESFDAVGACFLFHELPSDVATRAIQELRRVLRPGGILTLLDPCRDHLRPKSLWALGRKHGWSAVYFHWLARCVYEPFIADWQSIPSHPQWLSENGFEVLESEVKIPFELLVARRQPNHRRPTTA